MALSGSFNLQDVYDEFQPLYAQKDMRWMYETVINTNSSGGLLSDFSGLGRPVVMRTGGSNTGSSFTVNFDVTTNGLTTECRIEYHPASNPSAISTTTWTQKSDGSNSIQVTGLSSNVEYSYRIQFYNAFGTMTYYFETVAYSVTTTQPTLTAPSLRNTISYDGVNLWHNLDWDTFGDEPTGFVFEYSVNSTSNFQSIQNIYNEQNWGISTNPKSADIETGALPSPSDTFYFRVRATRSGYTTSPWSNIESYQH